MSIFSVEEFKSLTDVQEPMLIPSFQTIPDLDFPTYDNSTFDDPFMDPLLLGPLEEENSNMSFAETATNNSSEVNHPTGKYKIEKKRKHEITPYSKPEERKVGSILKSEGDFEIQSVEEFMSPKNSQNGFENKNLEDYLDFSNFNFDLNDYVVPEENRSEGALPVKERMDTTSDDAPPQNQKVNILEEIDRVVVHVGEKKSFRLFKNLIYYRKSTIRVRLICKNPINYEKLSVFCHLEYKSFKTNRKGDPSVWLPCDTPKGIVCQHKGKEKGVFVEYNFPNSGNEIEITFCVTYNVKEMCKNTGKNYIRIHFTVYFSPTQMQEVAIPMIWDTHGKPKNNEKPVRVKQLICCAGYPHPKMYYRVTNKSPFSQVTEYPEGIQPVYISQKFTPNGRTPMKNENYSHYLLNLLKSVNLPTRYLQKEGSSDVPVIHIGLMNGVDPTSPVLKSRARVIKANTGENYIAEKQTQLSEILCCTCRPDCAVVLYDINREVVQPEDVIRAFLFVLKQAQKAGNKAHLIVNVTWYYRFHEGRNFVLEKNLFEKLGEFKNVIIFASGGNGSEPISEDHYPCCISVRRNVVKVGSLQYDGNPQPHSNWGCDLFAVGSTTSVSCVNASVISGYLWRILSDLDNQDLITSLLTKGCVAVSEHLRVLSNAKDCVSKKRKREDPNGDDIILDALLSGKSSRDNWIKVPQRKRRKISELSLTSLLSKGKFLSLMSKLSLMRDLSIYVNKLQSFSSDSFQAGNLDVNMIENKTVDFDENRIPVVMEKIRFIFELFCEQRNGFIHKPTRLQVALKSAGIRNIEQKKAFIDANLIDSNEEWINFESFSKIVLFYLLPFRTECSFKAPSSIFEEEEEEEGEGEGEGGEFSRVSCLGNIFMDILWGGAGSARHRRNGMFPAFVGNDFRKFIKGCHTGSISKVVDITKTLEDMMVEGLSETFKTDVDWYCQDVIHNCLKIIQKDPYSSGNAYEEIGEEEKVIEVGSRLNVEDLELNEGNIQELSQRSTDYQHQKGKRNNDQRRVSYQEEDIVQSQDSFIVTGHAGSGKTWLLQRLAARSAKHVIDEWGKGERKGVRYSPLIPLFFTVHDFFKMEWNKRSMEDEEKGNSEDEDLFEKFLGNNEFLRQYPFLKRLLNVSMNQGKCHCSLFIDGMDSIQSINLLKGKEEDDDDESSQHAVSYLLDDLFGKVKRVVCSSREIGGFGVSSKRGDPFSSFKFLRINPFSELQQRHFVSLRLRLLMENDGLLNSQDVMKNTEEEEIEEEGERIYQNSDMDRVEFVEKRMLDLMKSQQLKPFLCVPSLLSLFVSTIYHHRKNQRIWEHNTSFQLCSNLLKRLMFRSTSSTVNDINSKMDQIIRTLKKNSGLYLEFLEKFAFMLHSNKQTSFSKVSYLDNKEHYGALSKIINYLLPLSVLPLFVKERNGQMSSHRFRFAHLSFQAHLASRHLIKTMKHKMKNANTNAFSSILFKQNQSNRIFAENIGFMIGDVWYTEVLLQIASGLGKKDFVELIHFLHENDQNHYLCNLMVQERKKKERMNLVKNELKKYKFMMKNEVSMSANSVGESMTIVIDCRQNETKQKDWQRNIQSEMRVKTETIPSLINDFKQMKLKQENKSFDSIVTNDEYRFIKNHQMKFKGERN